MIDLFKFIYQSSDAKIKRLFNIQVFLGIASFAIDYLFAYSLQLLFQSANLLPTYQFSFSFIENFKSSIAITASILIIISVIRFFTQSYKIYNNQAIYENMVAHLRKKLLQIIENDFTALNSHEIISYFTDNISGCSTYLTVFANIFLISLSSILLTLACLKISFWTTVISALFILLFFTPLKITNKLITAYGKKYQFHYDRIYKNIIVNLKNINYLNIYDKETSEFQAGKEHIDLYASNASSYYFLYGLKTSFPFLVGIITIIAIIITSKKYSLIHSSELLSFSYLFIRICQNLGELTASLSDSKKLSVEVERSKKWMQLKFTEKPETNNKKQIHLPINKITATNLSFKYPESTSYLFKSLNFTCQKGEILLIKGKSGAGKSTLLKIILGILPPTEGSICINEQQTQEVRGSLASRVGYIGPENYFVIGTLRDNLLYLNDNKSIPDPLLKKTLEMLNLGFLSKELDIEFNDNVQLSTGQKQRLSIARALIRTPDLFILDEATANLDSETEKDIIDHLSTLKENKIMIIISHKKSFDSIADYIINL